MSDDRPPDARTPIDRLIRVGFNPPATDNKAAVDRLRAALGSTARPSNQNGSDDRYEIGEAIGRGGVGAVYRGRDHNLDRDVAIKVLAEEHAHNRDLADRFVDEARIAGRLEHPGVVPVHEVGHRPDGRPFFSMKLVEGATLAELLKSRTHPRDDRRRFLTIFEKVCETLAYAHARGVVHRDVKPSNVMVGSFGEVQLMDWGLAKVLDQLDEPSAAPAALSITPPAAGTGSTTGRSETGSVMGTPPYMPPEQARGDVSAIDRRTDVFALGALLCEILTGEPPYTGSQREVRRQARDGDLAAAYARIAQADIEPDLLDLLRSALVADPDARLPDARALAARFSAYREARDAHLREAELNAARARIRLGLFVAIAALIATVAITWWWFDRDRIRQAQDARDRVAESSAELRDLHAVARDTLDAPRWNAVSAGIERAGRSLESDHLESGFRDRTASWLERLRREAKDANERIERAARDRAMVAALDRARLLATQRTDEQPRHAYRDAFDAYGIDVDALPATDAAERVRGSAIRDALVAALDGWTTIEQHLDFDRARRLFEIVRIADPDPMRHRVRVALLEGDHDTVRAVGKDLDPAVTPAETVIVVAHRLRRIGEVDAARSLLLAALELRPGAFWIHEQLARCALTGDPDPTLALRHCEALRALRPDLPNVWLRVADVRKAGGDRDGAEAAIRRALEIDPRCAAAHYDLGELAIARGDRPTAIASIRAALAIDDHPSVWHFQLGESLRREGDTDGARAAFEAAVERMPNHLQAIEKLGGLALQAGDFATADKWMTRLLEVGRNVVDRRDPIAAIHRKLGYHPGKSLGFAAFHLAERASQRGEVTEAMALYRESNEWFPTNQIAAGKLCIILIAIGEWDRAETIARASMERQPDFPLAQAALGQSLEKQGKYDDAHAAYTKMIESSKRLGIRSGAPRVMLRHLAKKRAAIPDLDAVLGGGSPPEDGAELALLGEIAIDRGDPLGGAALYRRALSAPLDPAARQTALLHGGIAAILAAEVATAAKRAEWRSHGLDCLEELLGTWRGLLGTPHAGTIRGRVANLELDRRLASVRGDRLEALAANERERFETFWRRVAAFAEVD